MIEYLEEIDRLIVLTVNSWHTPFLDELMWLISDRFIWIPLYVFLLYLAWGKMSRKEFFLFVGIAIGTVVIVDLISVHLFKNVFLRYRPSHNTLLTNELHFYELKKGEFYKGGMYGFVSSHAANFFALATYVGFSMKKHYPKLIWILLCLATLISFSRLYLGVHYLSDLISGGILGATIASLSYKFVFSKLKSRL
jgi:undecaprenyl-diphosphatase